MVRLSAFMGTSFMLLSNGSSLASLVSKWRCPPQRMPLLGQSGEAPPLPSVSVFTSSALTAHGVFSLAPVDTALSRGPPDHWANTLSAHLPVLGFVSHARRIRAAEPTLSVCRPNSVIPATEVAAEPVFTLTVHSRHHVQRIKHGAQADRDPQSDDPGHKGRVPIQRRRALNAPSVTTPRPNRHNDNRQRATHHGQPIPETVTDQFSLADCDGQRDAAKVTTAAAAEMPTKR